MEIHVKESTIIRPTHEMPKHCLKNYELDLLVPSIHVSGVHFYRRPNNSSNFFEAGLLKEALSKFLVPYYPMAGRLGRAEDGKFIKINCNGEAVLFMEAKMSCVIDDLSDFESNMNLVKLVPNVDSPLQFNLSIEGFSSEPHRRVLTIFFEWHIEKFMFNLLYKLSS